MSDGPTVEQVRTVTRRLEGRYGRPAPPRRGPVLDGLIATILSQNTTGTNARLAMRRLRERFPTWDAVLAAETDAVADQIRCAGLANRRAPRIQAILRAVLADRGELSLEHLAEAPSEEVMRQLTAYEGVGIKTAACVLLFTLAREEFPVDTHVLRLTRRLGWVPPNYTADQAYARLRERIPPADRHSLHVNLIAHGRAVCRARRPACDDCALLDICPFGLTRSRP